MLLAVVVFSCSTQVQTIVAKASLSSSRFERVTLSWTENSLSVVDRRACSRADANAKEAWQVERLDASGRLIDAWFVPAGSVVEAMAFDEEDSPPSLITRATFSIRWPINPSAKALRLKVQRWTLPTQSLEASSAPTEWIVAGSTGVDQ